MVSVAVIIPCYNAGRFLSEALASIPESSDDISIEIIVVDDGSNSADTLQALQDIEKDARIKVIRQENRGVSSARNVGVRASNSEFFLPLDADDFIEARFIELAVNEYSKNPRLGAVYSLADKFSGEQFWPWELPKYDPKLILFHNHIQNACLFRKSDWTTVGGYDEEMISGREDHDFLLKIIALGRQVSRIEEILFHYRQHETSLNREIGSQRSEQIKVMQKIAMNNRELYGNNIDLVMQQYMEEHFRLVDYQLRYSNLERWRRRVRRILRK
ncbi:glycosyltransferase family 2 protein [Neomicrococcus lactis]|uniref:glycosyltransferase family 2 protein n=1 Tax=Neomicrococcus lactis TaxID=732241 RepID=UPI0022FFD883|nr:glycosyltransferase [Neomicrococcus lactis]